MYTLSRVNAWLGAFNNFVNQCMIPFGIAVSPISYVSRSLLLLRNFPKGSIIR